jgi:hypothetical protein
MAVVIRVRRVRSSLPLARRYELELPCAGKERGPVERLVVRRGTAVRRLEPTLGTADAWSFIDEADRQWASGNRGWAVEFEPHG